MRKSKSNCKLTVIKRNKNVFQALNLPKILNLNPRNAMNKLEQIKLFIEEEKIDLGFISEVMTERNKKLQENLKLDNHTII